MAIEAIDAENRGTKEVPYGFIYFARDVRVLFTTTELRSGDGDGDWQPATDQHLEAAKRVLMSWFPAVKFKWQPVKPANYIEIAKQILREQLEKIPSTFIAGPLFTNYLILMLSTGEATTSKDVHNAWAIFKVSTLDNYHRDLIPFDKLGGQTQNITLPFAEAIKTAAIVFKEVHG